MRNAVLVDGTVADGFEPVRDAFIENFTLRGDVGASVSVYLDGVPVVDLWGGYADPDAGRPWAEDTTALVYSATKGATSVLFHLLVQRGEIDLDVPVAQYWPEFAEAGKETITVRQLLSHQAGLPLPEKRFTRGELFDGVAVSSALAAQEPLWKPGTAHGYHALTFGWLTGELISRVSGCSLGSLFASEIAKPLGLDLWIGLPEGVASDRAPLLDGKPDPNALDAIQDAEQKAIVLELISAATDPSSLLSRVLTTNGALPTPDAATWNDRRALVMEQPAANAVTNARSLARMYGACVSDVDGARLLDADTVAAARQEQVYGRDRVTIAPSRFGVGFQLDHPGAPLLGTTSFGHVGVGGALGFADPEYRVGFGYVQNQLSGSLGGEPRTAALIDALRFTLGGS